ncbi:MAG: hypothetical protein AB8G99_23130 [Planctomycetaceae bacterium]
MKNWQTLAHSHLPFTKDEDLEDIQGNGLTMHSSLTLASAIDTALIEFDHLKQALAGIVNLLSEEDLNLFLEALPEPLRRLIQLETVCSRGKSSS